MRILLFFFVALNLACAPKDRPLKGSKNSPQPDNRIQESAYNGSKLDVAIFSGLRLLEPHRVLSLAMVWQSAPSRINFKDLPGYDLLKSCWGGRNDVYIDVLQDEPHLVEFVLNFDGCTSLASFEASTKLYGREFYTLHFDTTIKGTEVQRGILKSLDYRTVNFSHEFKANNRNVRYRSSSQARLHEKREMYLVRRRTGEYYFTYSSQGQFTQNLTSSSFRVIEENGYHNYFADGNFMINRNRVTDIRHASIELEHFAPRAVYLRSGSKRHIFTNEKNKIEFRAAIGESGVNFDKSCGYINGNLESVEYTNHNQRRNQFFESFDQSLGDHLSLRGEIVKGSHNKIVLHKDDGVLTEIPAKCYLDSTLNLSKLAQPKTPFDLLFLK